MSLINNCLLTVANVVADSKHKYKTYQEMKSINYHGHELLLLHAKNINVNRKNGCVYTGVFGSDIYKSEKVELFVNDSIKTGSFPLLWKSEVNDEFALFKVEENMQDLSAVKKMIEVKALLHKNGKISIFILHMQTEGINKMKARSNYMTVTQNIAVKEKLFHTNTKYTCSNCGASSDKMMRCSWCNLSYYCDKTCQKENWKLHRLICI